ncbi:hypothetical protein OU995_21330 [Roseateles sp. SL47]|uniref:hypothetical protein n=1 Tax=Roseateles sp. SL47 TaxID=2995138 RepID=UPI0022710C3D|nr:hypothetical protein [Roseateles sp. SL47]WAC76010.1 hypothetical protein OU995_21330 [Roseateles sp. SL47]
MADGVNVELLKVKALIDLRIWVRQVMREAAADLAIEGAQTSLAAAELRELADRPGE